MNTVQISVRLSANLVARLDTYITKHPAMSRSVVIDAALDAYLPKVRHRAPPGAGQDAETGRAGRNFGVKAGREIAQKLGELIDPVATKVRLLDGRIATVRTARNRNTQWGCLDTVLESVDVLVCAYTKDVKNYEGWEIVPSQWEEHARPASPGHKLHGKLTLVRKSDVQHYGTKMADISL
jgi:hypothetical protein